VCIPAAPPDLECEDISYRSFTVLPLDPCKFDGGKKSGIDCEADELLARDSVTISIKLG
jgi:hypothetical protein